MNERGRAGADLRCDAERFQRQRDKNNGRISSRRPAPSSCDTDAGTAINVPIGTSSGSQNKAVPTDTAARVAVP